MKDYFLKNKRKILTLVFITTLSFVTLETPYLNIILSRITSVLLISILVMYVIAFSVSSRLIFLVAAALFLLLPFLSIFDGGRAAEFFGTVIYVLLAIGVVKSFVYYLKNI